jgi:hypothetical protein
VLPDSADLPDLHHSVLGSDVLPDCTWYDSQCHIPVHLVYNQLLQLPFVCISNCYNLSEYELQHLYKISLTIPELYSQRFSQLYQSFDTDSHISCVFHVLYTFHSSFDLLCTFHLCICLYCATVSGSSLTYRSHLYILIMIPVTLLCLCFQLIYY